MKISQNSDGAYNSGYLEISGNLLFLENSGNLKCTRGNFLYHIIFFRCTPKHTRQVDNFVQLQIKFDVE